MKTIVFFILSWMVSLSVFAQTNAEIANEKIGRGINLGNALDAPSEGEWGVTLEERYFAEIAEAGFNSVRIPIRWSAHTEATTPYTIDSDFINRVKWAVDQAFANNLVAIINIHHFNELFQDPEAEHDKFIAIWTQVSELFKGYSDDLIFEILNEPNTNLTAELWNTYLADAMTEIRKTNPTRVVMIGSAEWGGVGALSKLEFPVGEQDNVILTVHYYEPFHFTHQGASWVDGADAWVGTTWTGSAAQKRAIQDHFTTIEQKAEELGVPVNIGEFGSNDVADMDSRALWTSYLCQTFDELGFSYNYWAFTTSFAAYDDSKNTWNAEIKNALVGSFNTVSPDPTALPTGIDSETADVRIGQTGDCIEIIATGNGLREVNIVDAMGRILYTKTFSHSLTIPINQLQPGNLYCLIIAGGSTETQMYSFVY